MYGCYNTNAVTFSEFPTSYNYKYQYLNEDR
jgi:hypothetical protein